MKFDTQELQLVIKALEKAVCSRVVAYDLSPITPFFDFSVVCSVNNARQGSAAVNYLKEEALKNDWIIKGIADSSDSKWFLIDLNSIIVHVFVGDERERFNLDGLYYHLERKEFL